MIRRVFGTVIVVLLLVFCGCSNSKPGGKAMDMPTKTPVVDTGSLVTDTPTATPGNATDLDYAGYKLVRADEFDAAGLDPKVWNYELGYIRNHELQYYTADKANLFIKDGMLVIEGIKSPKGDAHRYTSASINTQKKVSYQYGIFEMRARLPYGKGIWPAFWMMGDESNSPDGTFEWPSCGEIDVMEMIGGGRQADATAYATAHWGGNNPYWYKNSADFAGGESRTYTLPDGIYNDGFHTFSLKWTKEELCWYVDGHRFFRQSITGEGMEAFHKKFFILLNLAIGGDWPGSPDETTVFPQQYIVDYVRVYQR